MARFSIQYAACLGATMVMIACAATRTDKASEREVRKESAPNTAEAIQKPAKMECMADPGALDSLRPMVKEALDSGDKERMRQALQKTDAHLAKMKEKMEKCKAKMTKAAIAENGIAEKGGMKCSKKPADTTKTGFDEHSGHVH